MGRNKQLSVTKRRSKQAAQLRTLKEELYRLDHDHLEVELADVVQAIKKLFLQKISSLNDAPVLDSFPALVESRLDRYTNLNFLYDDTLQYISQSDIRTAFEKRPTHGARQNRRFISKIFTQNMDVSCFANIFRKACSSVQKELRDASVEAFEHDPALQDMFSTIYADKLLTFASENIRDLLDYSSSSLRGHFSSSKLNVIKKSVSFAEKVLGHATPYCDETILDLDALSYQDCTLYGKTLRDKSLIDEDDHATIDAYVLSRKVHDRPKVTEQEIDPHIHFLETLGVDETYSSKIAQRMSRRLISEEDVAARVELLHDASKEYLLQDNPYLLVTDEDRFFRTLEKTHGRGFAAHEDTGRIEKEDPELESLLCAAYTRLEPYLDYFEENERLKVLDTMRYFGSKGPRGGDFVTAIIKDFKFLCRHLDVDDCSGFANDTSYMVVLPKHLQEKIPDIHNRIQEYL